MTTDRKFKLAWGLGLHLGASLLSMGALAHETQRKTELFNPGVGVADAETVQPATANGGRPVLYEGLGNRTVPVTTASAEAQAYFDQGLTLSWAFNHAEALRAFREAQRLDPNCAMCFWGEAFAHGSNINDPMHDEAIAPAYAALGKALELKGAASAKERALIEALSRRYAPDASADRAVLNVAWADSMRDVAAAYKSDVDVQVLFADALMNLQPWDYWEAGGTTTKGIGAELVATLEAALKIDPDHPAAAHLYIHTVEASATPELAEPYADRLRNAVPAAGHLVHMPSHIYVRVGRYADALQANRDAIKADEAMLAQVGELASPLFRFGYYPHNVHFLMISAQLAGSRQDVLEAAAKLNEVTSDQVSEELAWVQAIKTAPYTGHAQFSEPDVILELPDPGDRFPLVKGFWHYTRGIAHARNGDFAAAGAEAEAIGGIVETADFSGLEAQYLPARDLLGIARHLVEARVSQMQGRLAEAEDKLSAAVALQDGIPYMEPPYWYYPVRQTLGAVLLQQDKPAEAIEIFQQALKEQPRNGWALWGLAQAQLVLDVEAAAITEAAFQKAWAGEKALLTLDRL